MGNPQFPIQGADIQMLGRSRIMNRVWSDLTKTTPSNLSLIGPRFAGKTVLMNALAQKATEEKCHYKFVLHWHLGHVPPVSSDDFLAQLCEGLRECMVRSNEDTSEYCTYLEDHSFGHLAEVTDVLDSENSPILMLWDGFDKPLGQGKLSGHLWDQMRSIFYGKKHKVVTATRRPLGELIRSQDAITSPFWNIFDMTPVLVSSFDVEDCESIFLELPKYIFQQSAKTELINWSSGLPPLFLEVLNQITTEIPEGQVDNKVVNQAAQKATEKLSGMISTMWEDCPAGAKDLYTLLVERRELFFETTGKADRGCLIEKGFARKSGNKLTPTCRMLREHIRDAGPDAGSVARLFGTWQDYKSNIRGLLERRLNQFSRFDDRLHRLVGRAIEDIPDFPDDCLNNLTSIEERALDLIWQREFGPTKTIPQEIIDYWNQKSAYHPAVHAVKEQTKNTVPADRGLQCGLLQLLTGSKANFEPKAKSASKDTYVLINAIHSFRNRSQHSDGQNMHVGVAVAAIMTCLELLSCLEREIVPRDGQGTSG